jgi:hypothetical protein
MNNQKNQRRMSDQNKQNEISQSVSTDWLDPSALRAEIRRLRTILASLRNPDRSTPQTINAIIDRALENKK